MSQEIKIGKDTFSRCADVENYEEYSDWGDMYVGSTHKVYEVVYQ